MIKTKLFWCLLATIIMFSSAHSYSQEVNRDILPVLETDQESYFQEVDTSPSLSLSDITLEGPELYEENVSSLDIPFERNPHSLPWDPRRQAIDNSPFGKDYEKKESLSFSLMYCFTFTGKRSSYPLTGHTTIASMTYQNYLNEKWGLSISPYIAYYSFSTQRDSRFKNSNDFGFNATLSYFLTPTTTINLYREQSFNPNKNDLIPALYPMFPHNRTGLNFEFTKNNATFSIGVEHVEYRRPRHERW